LKLKIALKLTIRKNVYCVNNIISMIKTKWFVVLAQKSPKTVSNAGRFTKITKKNVNSV